MQRQEVEAILLLAGIRVHGISRIENMYWPSHPNYNDMRDEFPWWTVKVREGEITIGWRKKVISIDWTNTTRRGLVTKDDVTKDTTMVHAWSVSKAVEYLRNWHELPVVDATDPTIAEYVVETRNEMVAAVKKLFAPSIERTCLLDVVESPHAGIKTDMVIRHEGDDYTAHFTYGLLAMTLRTLPKPQNAE